jgi:hypothetical protein
VLDTRKTTPGLRILEKYAVRAAAAQQADGPLRRGHGQGQPQAARRACRRRTSGCGETFPDVPVQVEVTTVAEAVEAVDAGRDFLLCDNMAPDLLREVVAAVGGRAELEATGGLTLATRREYAERGGLPFGGGADPLVARSWTSRSTCAPGPRLLLCIDIGNTNTVLATFEGEKLVHIWRIKTEAGPPPTSSG